jgi:3'(2'), 5'-bisphosphate nucleotidase
VNAVEIIAESRYRVLEVERVGVRVGYQQDTLVLPADFAQEAEGAWQITDLVRDIVVYLYDIDTQSLVPVIEAVPLQVTLDRTVLCVEFIARLVKAQVVGGRVTTRHEIPPDVVIEGEVENRAVHVEHQRLATPKGRLWGDIHCYTARPDSSQEQGMDLTSLVEPIVALAEDAGRAILEVYSTDFDVQEKDDESPLTQADLASHRWIDAGLKSLTPDIPIISEESGLPNFEERRQWRRYWIVDPLDGTREFVNRNGEFTVNIALIEDNRPVLGVVHVPVQGKTYVGCKGLGAQRRDGNHTPVSIEVAGASANPVRVVGSRSHRGASLDTFLEAVGAHDMVPMGSSLKFCVVAEGGADIYPRLGPTSEWDTAAAQAVVEQAGGKVVTLDGKPMKYNAKADILNPHFFVIGAADRDWLSLLPERE